MGLLASLLGPILGIVATLAVFGAIYWDATRVEVARPLLWASIAAGPFAVGVWLYLYVSTAPMTGTLLTANTGFVLYGFEREVTREDDETAEPGTLPEK